MYFEDILKSQATHRQLPYNEMRSGQPLLGAHVFNDGLRRFSSGCLELNVIVGAVIGTFGVSGDRIKLEVALPKKTDVLILISTYYYVTTKRGQQP